MSLSLPPRLCLLLLLALSTPEARADEPLPPPSRWKACSRSGRYCAWMDPEAQRTTVVRVDERGRETPQWEMPGWFREVSLADDGVHLVVGCDGLLARDYDEKQVMVSFYRRGALLREVRLDELVRRFWMLQRTSSHWGWGSCRGLDEQGRFVVVAADGFPWRAERRLRFDVTSGARVP
jgi:hypothetical protein